MKTPCNASVFCLQENKVWNNTNTLQARLISYTTRPCNSKIIQKSTNQKVTNHRYPISQIPLKTYTQIHSDVLGTDGICTGFLSKKLFNNETVSWTTENFARAAPSCTPQACNSKMLKFLDFRKSEISDFWHLRYLIIQDQMMTIWHPDVMGRLDSTKVFSFGKTFVAQEKNTRVAN